MIRKGLGKGLGKGYLNLIPKDPFIHSLSAKGVKSKSKIFFIQPLNEGQDLNYIETHRGDYTSAKLRAIKMKKQLHDALPQGMINVAVQDDTGKELTLFARGNMKTIQLDPEYSVIVYADDTRRGFRHVAILMKRGYEVDKQTVNYLNRTWESYPFQTVLHKLLDKNFDKNKSQAIKESLDEKSGNSLIKLMAKTKFKKGDVVYYKNEPQRDPFVVYNVKNGKVSLSLRDYPDVEQDFYVNISKVEKFKGKKLKEAKKKLKKLTLSAKGKDEDEERTRILLKIPTGLTKEQMERAERKKKKIALTKRQKRLALANLGGAGAGFIIGGLTMGVGGMLIGVPIGTMAGFTVGEMTVGKERGRPPKERKYKSQVLTDLFRTREEQVKFREEQKRKTQKDGKKEK